jgi:hypothetical protein
VLHSATPGDDALVRVDKWLDDSYRLLISATAVTDCDLHVLEVSVRGQSTPMPFVRCDSMPDPFNLGQVREAAQGRTVTSRAVTISGIESPAEVNVIDGEYSIGCGATFTRDPGFIPPQGVICVRHVASDLPNTYSETLLVVGNMSRTFSSVTDSEVTLPPPPTGGGGPAGIGELLALLWLLFALPVAAGRARLTRRR